LTSTETARDRVDDPQKPDTSTAMSRSTITICTTCKREELSLKPTTEAETPAHGEQLLEKVRAAAEGHETVAVRGVACLMGCSHGCNAAITADGKMSYVLGSFTPDEVSAGALVEYAVKHAENENGVVPYRQWPQGVKGHFVARIPPLERVETN
ncbi:MAG: DUF1636 domain-containing protein, partial [Pseudomonadota bacterium]